MINCENIIHVMEAIAPSQWAEEWDNVGFTVGSKKQKVNKILVSLDVTPAVVQEAINKEVDIIVAHHPFIFKPIKKVTSDEIEGQIVSMLIKNNISVYVAHTNLDIAPGGISDILANTLELKNLEILKNITSDPQPLGYGRVGDLPVGIRFDTFISYVKKCLSIDRVRYQGDSCEPVIRVAVCSGSGADCIADCKGRGIDTYVTGDIKYHQARTLEQMGIKLVDIGHFNSENIVVGYLARHFRHIFRGQEVVVIESGVNADVFKVM